MSLEDIAVKTVTLYGSTAGYAEIGDVLYRNGFQDESGELADRVLEMVRTAVIRVKVRMA